MPTTRAQFVSRLTDSGILSRAELDAFATAGGDATAADDPAVLADALVRAQRLTPFQAEVLLGETTRPLRLGGYLLLDRVGSGGMGHVHKAVHERMNRVVALKVLPPVAAMDPGLVARFRREMEVAARLRHPNIVAAYDAGEAEGVHFLVMELVEGRDLEAVVAEDGPLAVDDALACVAQAADALAYAHGEGVLHRDVKPANLLRDGQGTVKVLDMGLARLEAAQGLTTTGDVIGTTTTMAPEQGEATRPVDQRSDVYGLGCTLWFLLTGRHLYERDSALQMLLAHAREPIPRLREARPDAPPEVEALFEAMVRKDPDERLPDMHAVLAGIRAVRDGRAPQTPPVRRPRRAATALRAFGPLVLVAALAVALWIALRGDDPEGGAPPVAPLRHVLRGHTGTVHSVWPHADGRRLLSGSSDNTIGVWDLVTGALLENLEGHEDAVRSVRCLRDGNTLVSASDDGTVRLWDLAKRSVTNVLRGHEGKVRMVAVAPDERWVASVGADGTLRIWDLPSGKPRVVRTEHEPWPTELQGLAGVVVQPGGAQLATVAFDRTVRLWDTGTFDLRKTLGPYGDDMGAVAFSGDGAYVLHDMGAGPVELRRSEDGALMRELLGHTTWIYSIACAPDRPLAATGSEDMTVRLWNLETGEALAVLEGHEFTVGALAFSPDGNLLASGSGDETIRIWDVSGVRPVVR